MDDALTAARYERPFPAQADGLRDQFRREVHPAHPLHPIRDTAEVIAVALGSDDILVRDQSGTGTVARVHLVWANHGPEADQNANWPGFETFPDLATALEALKQ